MGKDAAELNTLDGKKEILGAGDRTNGASRWKMQAEDLLTEQQPWPRKTTAARCQKSILDSVHGTESLELREAVLETPAHAEEKIKE
jgi:hypothetical protein